MVEAAQQSLRGRRRREIVGAGTDEQQEKGRGVYAHGHAVAPTSIQRHFVEQDGKGDESGYDRRGVNGGVCDFFIDADPTWRWGGAGERAPLRHPGPLDARLRSLGSSTVLRRRIDFGVTSTSSSSWI